MVRSTRVTPYVSACHSRERLKHGFNYLTDAYVRQRKSKR